MKKTIFCLLFGSLACQTLQAQEYPDVQWASKVISVSSEYTDVDKAQSPEFKAEQVLGAPNKLPSAGSSACAWSPMKPDNPEGDWIKVGFDKPMKIHQIVIAENLNPGSISKVAVYDIIEKEYVVYNNPNVGALNAKARMMSIMYSSEFEVRAVKIYLSSGKVVGFNQIDAIGISTSKQTIEAKINIIKEPEVQIKSKPENLGTAINSEYQEIAPTVAPDGKTIFFTRSKHPENIGNPEKQDIWYAEINAEGKFSSSKNIGAPINTDLHNSSFSITPDGNTMLLNNIYNEDGSMERGLSMTTRQASGKWGKPQKVQIDDFYNKNNFSEFCLSQDAKVLLMTVQRADSKGGKDLYFSRSKGDGSWTAPTSLGNVVNTASNETSPFLASDGKTLYFSTAGFSGFGSNDIFVSRRLDDSWTNWSIPQNMGNEINTPEWDGYFSITAKADYAYYCSYNNTMGDSDVFRIKVKDQNKPDPVALIKGNVYNKKTNKPIEAKIIYDILPNGENAGNANSNPQTGAYKVVLPLKKNYALLAEAHGFIPVEDNIDLTDSTNYTEISKDLYLVPIEKGEVLELNNIFFQPSTFNLLPASFPELNRIAVAMKENPQMKIRLEGHTEVFGDKKDQYELAENRVKSVKGYLVRQGIDKKRIDTKSWGGTKPKTTGTSDAERQRNRRVEMRITATE